MKHFILLSILTLFVVLNVTGQSSRVYKKPEFVKNWSKPGKHPDHIVLNFSDDPATTISVTWRTSNVIKQGYGEIALSLADPRFISKATTHKAITQLLEFDNVVQVGRSSKDKLQFDNLNSHYHSLTFKDLIPNTMYAYRVGDGKIWSEWIQFKTASDKADPFSFLYVGDAQNYVMELWSRLIREGYKKAPEASFIIHAGDLINNAHSEHEWHEWYIAGGWIHRSLPSLSIPGNHEYMPFVQNDVDEAINRLSVQWNYNFTLPNNGPKGIEETVYYVDYQGVRFIGLNSNIMIDEQTIWLEEVLKNNPNKWTIVTYHHPLYSASRGRDNVELRSKWKPLFDKYKVDLALQGHDHAYTRGRVSPDPENIVSGQNTRDLTGTVYVVSVSGGKMYPLKEGWQQYDALRDRTGEYMQLFQVISLDGNKLSYQAYTAVGDLYDSFNLIKNESGLNSIVEKKYESY
jgi:hypothetical protein|tara:strand:+ start:1005 stop:2384 length:1380 start_codon:yes stop_codon:yes gene_type:complete